MGAGLEWDQALKWLFIALVTSPIWGAFLFVAWEGAIKPHLIPEAEIKTLAIANISQYGERAAEMAFIEEDRAWRYNDSFAQGKWRRVRHEIERLADEA